LYLDLRKLIMNLELLLKEIVGQAPESVFNILSLHFFKQAFDPEELHTCFRKIALKVHPDKVTEEEKPIAEEIFKFLYQAYNVLKSNKASSQDLDFIIILSSHVELVRLGVEDPNKEDTQLSVLEDLLLLPERPLTAIPDELWQKAQTVFDDLVRDLRKKPKEHLLVSEKAILRSVKLFNDIIDKGRICSKAQRETTEMHFFKERLFPTLNSDLDYFYSKVLKGKLTYVEENIHEILASVFYLGSKAGYENLHPYIRYRSPKERAQYLLALQKKFQPQIQQFNSLIFIVRELKILNKGIDDLKIKKEISNYVLNREIDIKRGEPFASYPNNYSLPELSLSLPTKPSNLLILNRIKAIQNINQATTLKDLLTIYKEITEKRGVYASLFEERGFFGIFGKYGATKTSQRCLREVKNRIAEHIIYYKTDNKTESVDIAKKILTNYHGRFWKVGKTTNEKVSEKIEKQWKGIFRGTSTH
jgi:hypothetical protein